jgi:thiol-disulfide isomerase/thioredoxin
MEKTHTIDTQDIKKRFMWESLAGPAVVLFSSFVALWVAQNRAEGDFAHMLEPMQRLIAGDTSNVYTTESFGTSLTSWLAVTVIPFVLGRLISSDQGAWTLAGLVAIPMFIASIRFSVRAIDPSISITRAWLLSGVALVLPTTLACWTEYYHPQDVAGIALVIFALGFAARSQWGFSGLLFGLAILTRQWALLIALLVSPLTRNKKDFLMFAGVGGIVTLAGILPWVALGNNGTIWALTGYRAGITDHTFVGRFIGGEGREYVNYIRLLPLVAAACIALWMTLTKKGNVYWLMPLAVTAMALRMLFDVATYTYYWAPICVFLLLVHGPKWKTPIVAVILSAVAWSLKPYLITTGNLGALLATIWIPIILIAVVVLAWWLTDDKTDKENVSETSPDATDTKGGSVNTLSWIVAAALIAAMLPAGLYSIAKNEEANPDQMRTLDMFSGYGTIVASGAPLTMNPDGELTGVIAQIEDLRLDYDLTVVETVENAESGRAPSVIQPGITRAVLVTSHWCITCVDTMEQLKIWAMENNISVDQLAVVGIDSDESRDNWPPELWALSLKWRGPVLLDDQMGQLKLLLGDPKVGTVIYLDSAGNVTGTTLNTVNGVNQPVPPN